MSCGQWRITLQRARLELPTLSGMARPAATEPETFAPSFDDLLPMFLKQSGRPIDVPGRTHEFKYDGHHVLAEIDEGAVEEFS